MANNPEQLDLLCRQIAMLLLAGSSYKDISQQLSIPYNRVARLAKNERTKKVLKSVRASSIEGVKKQIKERMSSMVEDALETLHQHLKDRNLNAAVVFFEMAGVAKAKEEEAKDTGIQINLNLGNQPKTIEGEAYAIQDGQGKEGVSGVGGEEPIVVQPLETSGPVQRVKYEKGDLLDLGVSDERGADSTVQPPTNEPDSTE